jgi:hypothetical protein
MAKTIPMRAGERDRPLWLSWSAFRFQTRYAGIAGQRIHYIDEGSGPAPPASPRGTLSRSRTIRMPTPP